jgi:hypothetical protein
MFIQVLCSDPATAKKKGRNTLLQNKATPLWDNPVRQVISLIGTKCRQS